MVDELTGWPSEQLWYGATVVRLNYSMRKGIPIIEAENAEPATMQDVVNLILDGKLTECGEPMFLEWCAKNGFRFELWIDGWREFHLRISTNGGLFIALVMGATPSEARARAIVAAAKVSITK